MRVIYFSTLKFIFAESRAGGPDSRDDQATGAGGRAAETGRAAAASARTREVRRLRGDDPQGGTGERAQTDRSRVRRSRISHLSPWSSVAWCAWTSTSCVLNTSAPWRSSEPYISDFRPPSVWSLIEAWCFSSCWTMWEPHLHIYHWSPALHYSGVMFIMCDLDDLRCGGKRLASTLCACRAVPEIFKAGRSQHSTSGGDLWHPLWQAGTLAAILHRSRLTLQGTQLNKITFLHYDITIFIEVICCSIVFWSLLKYSFLSTVLLACLYRWRMLSQWHTWSCPSSVEDPTTVTRRMKRNFS